MLNLRCKTNYANGKLKSQWLGPALLALNLVWPFDLFAIERDQWLFSQWSRPPEPNPTHQIGYLVRGEVVSAGKSLSSGGHLTWDARYFELSTRFTSQTFSESEKGNSDSSLSVELARRYLSQNGRYGRLGVEYYWLRPGEAKMLRVGFNTGILETSEVPFLLRVDIHYFAALQKGWPSVLVAALDVGYAFGAAAHQPTWKIGGVLNWSYRQQADASEGTLLSTGNNSLRAQHMIFSLGPWVEFATENLHLRLTALGRMWLDKRWSLQPGTTGADAVRTSYPSSFIDPGIDFSLSYLF